VEFLNNNGWEWAIKRASKHEIARTTGVLYNIIVSVFKHEYGGMNSTRFEHLRDKIIGLRKKGFSLEKILKFHIIKGKTFFPSKKQNTSQYNNYQIQQF